MFDKKQKSFAERILLVNDGLYDRKASSMNKTTSSYFQLHADLVQLATQINKCQSSIRNGSMSIFGLKKFH